MEDDENAEEDDGHDVAVEIEHSLTQHAAKHAQPAASPGLKASKAVKKKVPHPIKICDPSLCSSSFFVRCE